MTTKPHVVPATDQDCAGQRSNRRWQDAPPELLRPLLAATRLGVITDIDGTISPLAVEPGDARVTPRNRALLAALSERLTLVAAVSGRAAADAYRMVGIPGLTVFGNHGLEQWVDGQAKATTTQAAAFRPALSRALAHIRQLEVDDLTILDKTITAAVHFRGAVDPAAVAAAYGPVVERIAAQYGLVYFQGRMVFELRPPLAINKGTALRQLVQDHQLDAAIYLGDDTTDVDALRMARRLRRDGACHAIALGVVARDTPDAVCQAADWLLAGVSDVEAFLAWLLASRRLSAA